MQGEIHTSSGRQAQVEFYLTDGSTGAAPQTTAGRGLRPALFAGYRDLTALRYDFPVVLVAGRRDETAVQPLSALIDGALDAVATDAAADRLRHCALRLEQEIRRSVAKGAMGTFGQLWQAAATAAGTAAEDGLADSLRRLRAAIIDDGEIVDCDAALPGRFLRHAIAAVQQRKAGRFRTRLTRLIQRLSDILQADLANSEEGRSADNLKAAIGTTHAQLFDFEVMSRLLGQTRPAAPLPENRRRRIVRLLSVLRGQPFFPVAKAPAAGPTAGFVFESCAAALEANRQRLPRAVELVKTMAIAELEVDGRYDEARHDAIFAGYGGNGLATEEFADFPDYLVCVSAQTMTPAESARIAEAMAAGLPMKILLQTDDLVSTPPAGGRLRALAMPARVLVEAALGLGDVFVLQASASHLLRCRGSLFSGLAQPGPALFSIFSGATGHAGGLPPYLLAAAAMESRAFPALVYDPAAGADWASRFTISGNPQAGRDWPEHALDFEDAAHQRLGETLAFTLADFLACDERFASDFAPVPRAGWSDRLMPIARLLAEPPDDAAEASPTVLLIDSANLLHKTIVDTALVREAQRGLDRWRALQERGGINNSYAALALAAARREWEEQTRAAAMAAPAPAATPAEPELAEAAAATPEAEPERSPDEAYIETSRCSSCNECTQINDKMFAYDKNKQAYIANPDTGTYRQLVEAAEACQVSVIHPGKPRNPQEPGLDELMERAKAFA